MTKELFRFAENVEDCIGQFVGSDRYNLLIENDTDLYAGNLNEEKNEENVIFKFRKNVFSKEECDLAYAGLREAATLSQNRGKAAGPRGNLLSQKGLQGRDWVTNEHNAILDFLTLPLNSFDDGTTVESIRDMYKDRQKEETRGQIWIRSEVVKVYPEYHGWFDKWLSGIHNLSRVEKRNEALQVINNYISVTNYAKPSMSGIAGYFDRYPRIPYGRETSYTEKNLEKFKLCYPYLNKLNSKFKELIPGRWEAQRNETIKLDPKFVIDDTVFTTLTVNYNWRTACHRDAGDLASGFSNICGVTGPEGKGWRGGYFILPEYKIAINLQPGDMLLVNNHEGIHANDELIGDNNDRMTIVAYFREKMLDLKSWEYENLRKQFVEERRLNKTHKYTRNRWNGVSPNMFEEQEWYDYMIKHDMKDPYAEEAVSDLSTFF